MALYRRRNYVSLHFSQKAPKTKSQKKSKVVPKKNSEHSGPKPKTKTALAIWAIVAIVLLLVIGRFLGQFGLVMEPLGDRAKERQYVWDGKYSINIVVKAEQVQILHYDPQTKQATILNVPQQTHVELPRSYGTWPVSSIYELGEAEHPPLGRTLLKQSLSRLLGQPIDGFIQTDESIVDTFNGDPLKIIAFMRQARTDLDVGEQFKLLWGLSGLRKDKIKTLDLSISSITESKLLADSTRVLGINNVQLDLFVRDRMKDTLITKEDMTVAVYNTTDHSGLATEVGRIASNLGTNVIITANSQQHLAKTVIVLSEPAADKITSKTYQRFGQIFAPSCLANPCKVPDAPAFRADINVFVGEDFYTANY